MAAEKKVQEVCNLYEHVKYLNIIGLIFRLTRSTSLVQVVFNMLKQNKQIVVINLSCPVTYAIICVRINV